jgi:hypothetical protein
MVNLIATSSIPTYSQFNFYRFINIVMHLDIVYGYIHNNIYEFRKAKMTYKLEQSE